ncbi:ABC transporter ATP-binding protein [Clostridium sp. YIM B02515]|uniref:ABC transporter ATP-binding protein n=1 Tax=Clostridium rhizosphaerae TaxID=2803861 RepID=A0ABS1TB54_9CLOT|nr:ABC transporter ATP-binding protein [Clostridium rhizosphaerae]MBL4936506.1 ABC transporter ATP-binding protein [Clostridium rhizosphaerae]
MENINEPIISIKDLRMSYGSEDVLKGINIDIHKGQIIGYIGPNGAGKSTTVKILLGILNNYRGTIKIFGEDISNGSIEYKKKIGYVPETAEVYENLTAREYLTFIGELYGLDYEKVDEKAKKLMELFGIDNVYDSRISSFSKGMRQKVLIISSLLHNPDILFLDEPLSGLDANSVMVVKEIMSELASQGKTIFYSSHIMDVVERISSRIVLINGGQVVADGTFEELKAKSKEGSLEEIFNQLTGFNQHKQIAEEFVSVLSSEA